MDGGESAALPLDVQTAIFDAQANRMVEGPNGDDGDELGE